MSDHLWLGLYRLAYYMLTTLPALDTLEPTERQQVVLLKASLVQFVRVTEERFNLPHTIKTKDERDPRRLAYRERVGG